MIKLSDIIKSGGGNAKINRFINRYVLSKKEKKDIIDGIKESGVTSNINDRYKDIYVMYPKDIDTFQEFKDYHNLINNLSEYILNFTSNIITLYDVSTLIFGDLSPTHYFSCKLIKNNINTIIANGINREQINYAYIGIFCSIMYYKNTNYYITGTSNMIDNNLFGLTIENVKTICENTQFKDFFIFEKANENNIAKIINFFNRCIEHANTEITPFTLEEVLN